MHMILYRAEHVLYRLLFQKYDYIGHGYMPNPLPSDKCDEKLCSRIQSIHHLSVISTQFSKMSFAVICEK